MMDQFDRTRIEKFASRLKCAFANGLSEGKVQDLAFIGNASSIYAWHPSLMVDVDMFLFVEALDRQTGFWLLQVRDEISWELEREQADFELRIIEARINRVSLGSAALWLLLILASSPIVCTLPRRPLSVGHGVNTVVNAMFLGWPVLRLRRPI